MRAKYYKAIGNIEQAKKDTIISEEIADKERKRLRTELDKLRKKNR